VFEPGLTPGDSGGVGMGVNGRRPLGWVVVVVLLMWRSCAR